MQNIQDKEFDQVFKSQFEEVEIEPSADLWSAIETQLEDGSKRKSIFSSTVAASTRFEVVLVMAAAVAVMVLTIGLIFYPSAKKQLPSAAIVYHQPDVSKPEVDKVQKSNAVLAVILPKKVAAIDHITYTRVKAMSSKNEGLIIDSAAYSKKDLVAMQPLRDISHPDYKTINIKQEKITLPKATPEEIMLASANAGRDEVENENAQRENKGIRNVGDLVNFVVDKLDKREEKTIQFQTDDDNSSLIAINIGIIKFNQKKQK